MSQPSQTPDTSHANDTRRRDRTPTLAVPAVGVAGRYSNRPDLLEQLRKVAVILSDDGRSDGDGAGTEITTDGVIRSRRLRDRFPAEDLQAMIDLYKSGTTAKQVAEKYGVSLRSIKRLLRQHGVGRRARSV